MTPAQLKSWYRLPEEGLIGGVLAGLAYRWGLKPWGIRLLWLFLVAVTGLVPLLFCYILGCFLLPRRRLTDDQQQVLTYSRLQVMQDDLKLLNGKVEQLEHYLDSVDFEIDRKCFD